MEPLIFAFDLGKASLGLCIRKGHEILKLDSLLIPADHGKLEDLRTRRHAIRTRLAHKAREENLEKLWNQAGLNPLNSDDIRLMKEFPAKSDSTIYTSCLLRIALLQEKPLKEWQIYKALRSAIQYRGYDAEIPWKNRGQESKDDEESEGWLNSYNLEMKELISNPSYHLPCYREASLMGLWSEDTPHKFLSLQVTKDANPVRKKGFVVPRTLIEKECSLLFEVAKKQLPNLNKIPIEEFLYGSSGKPYGSSKHWDGVLGQKVPRFENRILAKCVLMSNRNVCAAKALENIEAVFLMQLKDLRFPNCDGERVSLTIEEIKKIYELKKAQLFEKAEKLKKGEYVPNELGILSDLKKIANAHPKFRQPPIKINLSGRSRFCRPALILLKAILLTGVLPAKDEIEAWIQNQRNIVQFQISQDTTKGVSLEEIVAAVSQLGQNWEKFHIADNREAVFELAKTDSVAAIQQVYHGLANPIVRNRLQWYAHILENVTKQFGKPDKVILEFVRAGKSFPLEVLPNNREKISEYADMGSGETRGQFKKHKQNTGQIIFHDGKAWRVRQVYPFESEKLVKSELLASGKKLYMSGILFYSSMQIKTLKPTKAGNNTFDAGIFNLGSIKSIGSVKMKTPHGSEIVVSLSQLIEAEFQPVK